MVAVRPSRSLVGGGRTSPPRCTCTLLILFSLTLYYWTFIDIDKSIRLSIETISPAAAPITIEVDPAELDASRTYIRSIKSFGRALKFLHIPKNAGSAIEEVAGGTRPQYWGGCLFKHKPKVRDRATGCFACDDLIIFLRTPFRSHSGNHVFIPKEDGGRNMSLGGIFRVNFSL